MARPLKNGLDYFPLDVNFFSDKKIRRLRAKFGSDGVTVYIFLLCEIYRSGYYIEYDDDMVLDIADELNLSENYTMQVLNYLFSRSLLLLIECKLAVPVKVITAESIQRQYQEIKKSAKRDIEVERELWVLKENETESFIKVRPVDVFSEKNSNKSGKNNDKSQKNDTKESKEKKSKENESKAVGSDAPPLLRFGSKQNILLSDDQYHQLIKDFGQETADLYIEKASLWCDSKKRELANCDNTIRLWLQKDGYKKGDYFDVEKYKFVINNF